MTVSRSNTRKDKMEIIQYELPYLEDLYVFSVGNTRYVAWKPPYVRVPFPFQNNLLTRVEQPYHIKNHGPRSLVTVLHAECESWITKSWIQQKLQSYRSADDVFRDEFLNGVIFTGGTESLQVSPEASDHLASLGTVWTEIENDETVDRPSPGPYLASERQLWEARRLYDDMQGAFMTGIIPSTTW